MLPFLIAVVLVLIMLAAQRRHVGARRRSEDIARLKTKPASFDPSSGVLLGEFVEHGLEGPGVLLSEKRRNLLADAISGAPGPKSGGIHQGRRRIGNATPKAITRAPHKPS